MLLAHGTTSKNLDRILKNGLEPRGGRKSLWKDCPSHPEMVYLSNAYAFYFGQQAVKKKEDVVVFEVDIDERFLYPDEDFLGQITTNDPQWNVEYPDLKERTLVLRDYAMQLPRSVRYKLAIESIKRLGNACHRGLILPIQITRAARIPNDQIFPIVLREHDPTISLINCALMGEQHRAFQESLFERFPLKID